MKFINDDLYMVRGDDDYLTAMMEDDGEERAFASGDAAVLSVRRAVSPYSQEIGDLLFTVKGVRDADTGAMVFSIPSSYTASEAFYYGHYVYDIQATLVDGGVTTLRPESAFVLLREVTI